MNSFLGNVHLVAGPAGLIDGVLALLEKEGIKTIGNPDVFVRRYTSFGIDHAHELVARSAARAFGARRAFVISADSMTNEAQNALLKTLEEPAANALFFFIVPSPETLLPTFRSRAQMLILSNDARTNEKAETRAFLKATEAKRLDMLKPLLEKGDDERRDLGAIISFLSSLERSLADDVKKENARVGIEAIYRARKHITDRGALVKPLLEQVALLTPRL